LFHVVDTPEEAMSIITQFGQPDKKETIAPSNETYMPNLDDLHKE
jgi:hypothetical protein